MVYYNTKGFSIRDILHAMLAKEGEISTVSNKTSVVYLPLTEEVPVQLESTIPIGLQIYEGCIVKQRLR